MLNDKIKGAIVGLAYGDALGLGAEFMSKHEVHAYYPDGLRNFNQIIRDSHRFQWKRGEYTNDTAFTTLALESILESGGFVPGDICRKFQKWYAAENRDVVPVLKLFAENKEWPENPIRVAHLLWHSSRVCEASNEPLHRAIVTGLTSPEPQLNEHTRKIVLMTHDDSRCVASTMVLARVVHNALNDRKDDIDCLLKLCSTIDHRTLPFLRKAWEGDVESIVVDDRATQSWTRKGMAAALWGYWHHDNAEDTIHSVIDLGGDANTNAGMAGALAGLKYGYDSLPEEKENILNLDYLLDLARRLTDYSGNN